MARQLIGGPGETGCVAAKNLLRSTDTARRLKGIICTACTSGLVKSQKACCGPFVATVRSQGRPDLLEHNKHHRSRSKQEHEEVGAVGAWNHEFGDVVNGRLGKMAGSTHRTTKSQSPNDIPTA